MRRLFPVAMMMAPIAAAALAFLCFVGAGAQGKRPPETVERLEPPTSEVREAIRSLLSEDPREEARGEQALKRLGRGVTPQLRYWVRKVRGEADRVERVLREIQGEEVPPLSLQTTPAGEYLQQKFFQARDLERDGNHREALELAEAILALDRQNPYAWQLRRLARQARHRLTAKEVLEPTIEVTKVCYEVGETPEVMFRLTNHRRTVVRVNLDRGVLGEVDAVVTRRSFDGSMRRDRHQLPIQVVPEVSSFLIGPGRSWETHVSFMPDETLPPAGVVARFQIAGRFRPNRWSAEGAEAFDNISLAIPTTEFWIVPAGQEDMCERPLEKLTAALLFGKPEPLFVAGWLAVWAGEDDAYLNEGLIDTLISHIGDLDAPRLALACRLLGEATGLEFQADPKRWQAWWAKVRATREGEKRPTPAEGKAGTEPLAPTPAASPR